MLVIFHCVFSLTRTAFEGGTLLCVIKSEIEFCLFGSKDVDCVQERVFIYKCHTFSFGLDKL